MRIILVSFLMLVTQMVIGENTNNGGGLVILLSIKT
jgi:hypothetical protein